MRPVGIANSEQLSLLKRVLEQYCKVRGITHDEDRDRIGSSILRLFDRGLSTAEEITAALADISTREDGRPSIALASECELREPEKTNPSPAR